MKVAIVTGASQGIGAGIAGALVSAGYAVVGTSRSIQPSREHRVIAIPDNDNHRVTSSGGWIAVRQHGSMG
jgi:NAD(P)-dependent dehydrogenase (short-subunit alcohol dehydrogenase family)